MELGIYITVSLLLVLPLMFLGATYVLETRVDDLSDFGDMVSVFLISLLATVMWPLIILGIAVILLVRTGWRAIIGYLIPYAYNDMKPKKWWYSDLKQLRKIEDEMRSTVTEAATYADVKYILRRYSPYDVDYGMRRTLKELQIRVLDDRITELEQTR